MKRLLGADLILSKIRIDGNGCWIWQGYIGSDGYGRCGRKQSAHLYSYRAFCGPVPKGLELDHLCRVITCVNPAHLEPVTHAENKRRRYVLVTHCKHGHEFTPENTYVWAKRNTRTCRTCNRQHAANRHRRLAGMR